MSQTSFGDIGGVGKTTVISWERGTAFPNASFLEAAATYGIDVAFVVTGSRVENTAITPMELSYLRVCRRLADADGGQKAGNAALLGVMASYGITLVGEEEK